MADFFNRFLENRVVIVTVLFITIFLLSKFTLRVFIILIKLFYNWNNIWSHAILTINITIEYFTYRAHVTLNEKGKNFLFTFTYFAIIW